MKRHGNLFEKIVDLDNIILAHQNARKRKTRYREVKAVDKDVIGHCKMIQQMLMDKSFNSSEYEMFTKEDKGKVREIFKLPYFPDRIIQHAIMQVIEPIWKKTLIADTYQAIKGRGVHKCLKKVKHAVQVKKKKYCLQIDIKKYYPSINNTLMKEVVREKIKCKDTLWVLDEIIDGHEGVPIGNYISQYLGNIFVSKLDHRIKEVLRVKDYYRYCDDIIVVSDDKEELRVILSYVKDFLRSRGLSVKENYQVYKISEDRGIDCLGYVVYKDRVDARRSIVRSFRVKVYNGKVESIPSYTGWFMHCDCKRLIRSSK